MALAEGSQTALPPPGWSPLQVRPPRLQNIVTRKKEAWQPDRPCARATRGLEGSHSSESERLSRLSTTLSIVDKSIDRLMQLNTAKMNQGRILHSYDFFFFAAFL